MFKRASSHRRTWAATEIKTHEFHLCPGKIFWYSNKLWMHVLLNHSYAPLNKCSGSWMSPRLVFIVNTPALNLMQYHCAHTPWFNINLCITWLQLCLQAPRQQLCLAGYIESWSLPVIFKQHKPLRIYFNMAQTHRRAEAMSHIDKIQYPDGLFWNSIAHQGGWHYKQQSAHSKVQKMTECNDKTHMWRSLEGCLACAETLEDIQPSL